MIDNKLTEEQKRILIAEACGWRKSPVSHAWCKPGHWDVRHYGASWVSESEIPDYFHDLNAMHEAEKIFSKYQWLAYYGFLLVAASHNSGPSGIDATAEQRAECFGQTLGLW